MTVRIFFLNYPIRQACVFVPNEMQSPCVRSPGCASFISLHGEKWQELFGFVLSHTVKLTQVHFKWYYISVRSKKHYIYLASEKPVPVALLQSWQYCFKVHSNHFSLFRLVWHADFVPCAPSHLCQMQKVPFGVTGKPACCTSDLSLKGWEIKSLG